MLEHVGEQDFELLGRDGIVVFPPDDVFGVGVAGTRTASLRLIDSS
jgi:hypothetical protein